MALIAVSLLGFPLARHQGEQSDLSWPRSRQRSIGLGVGAGEDDGLSVISVSPDRGSGLGRSAVAELGQHLEEH